MNFQLNNSRWGLNFLKVRLGIPIFYIPDLFTTHLARDEYPESHKQLGIFFFFGRIVNFLPSLTSCDILQTIPRYERFKWCKLKKKILFIPKIPFLKSILKRINHCRFDF